MNDEMPNHLFGMPDQTAAGPSKAGLAQWLVVLAGVGIAARVLIMAACANRISFADNLLNGGTGTIDDADQADNLVRSAGLFSALAFLAFLGVLITVSRRAKRGDALYAAVNKNPRVRLVGRVYLISIGIALLLGNTFRKDPTASPEDQIRSVTHGDWATIALNTVVIAFLIAVMVVTRREIAKARAAGAVG